MRKIKLQMQVSADGFVGGPNGEMDWMAWNWDAQLIQYVTVLMESMDCIILGRKLAEGFIPHWAAVAANPEAPDFAAGKTFTDTPKVVFTKTLQDTGNWANTTLAKGDLVAEIMHLKKQAGGDILVYGGADFVSSLLQAGLIDELHLFINPTALGEGLPIFKNRTSLQVADCQSFDCGIVVMHYQPSKK